jgi:hypothetical protein
MGELEIVEIGNLGLDMSNGESKHKWALSPICKRRRKQ